MADFLTALGLALAMEGMAYGLFPDGMKAMMRRLEEVPPAHLRAGGLAAAAIGVGLVWMIRG